MHTLVHTHTHTPISPDGSNSHMWEKKISGSGRHSLEEYCCFLLCFSGRVACGPLVPWLGIQLMPPALEVRNLNYGTTREVPWCLNLNVSRQRMYSFNKNILEHLLWDEHIFSHWEHGSEQKRWKSWPCETAKNTSGLLLRTRIFFLVTASATAFCNFHTRTRTHTHHTMFLKQLTYN